MTTQPEPRFVCKDRRLIMKVYFCIKLGDSVQFLLFRNCQVGKGGCGPSPLGVHSPSLSLLQLHFVCTSLFWTLC